MYNLICELIKVYFLRIFNLFCEHDLTHYYLTESRIVEQYKKLENSEDVIQLQSNVNIGTLFRKTNKPKKGLNMDSLDGVIKLNKEERTIEIGARTTFHTITLETLKHNLMPKVLPELSSITVGGAICGVGLESSSFKYGWVHDTLLEMDVLLSNGDVVTCTPDNKYSDLFYAMPNSYGTLGYITRVKMELMETKPYVYLRNKTFTKAEEAFKFMENICTVRTNNICETDKTADFIDGVAFSKDKIVIVVGKFTDVDDACSHYPTKGIYYESLKTKKEDRLSLYDYCWRWDSDMFWGTANMPVLKNKWVRQIFGRTLFNTPVLRTLNLLISKFNGKRTGVSKSERIIQDIGIPMKNTTEFFEWLDKEINVYPVWLCPIMPKDSSENTYLWNLNDNNLYFDIAMFGRKTTEHNPKDAHYNKLIEEKMLEMGGSKSFYSDAYFTEEQFSRIIDMEKYKKVKSKYDQNDKFMNLYDKVITNNS